MLDRKPAAASDRKFTHGPLPPLHSKRAPIHKTASAKASCHVAVQPALAEGRRASDESDVVEEVMEEVVEEVQYDSQDSDDFDAVRASSALISFNRAPTPMMEQPSHASV